jgi:hypothetical protein
MATHNAYALLGLPSYLTLAALGQQLVGNESAGLRIEAFGQPFGRLPHWAVDGQTCGTGSSSRPAAPILRPLIVIFAAFGRSIFLDLLTHFVCSIRRAPRPSSNAWGWVVVLDQGRELGNSTRSFESRQLRSERSQTFPGAPKSAMPAEILGKD